LDTEVAASALGVGARIAAPSREGGADRRFPGALGVFVEGAVAVVVETVTGLFERRSAGITRVALDPLVDGAITVVIEGIADLVSLYARGLTV
jgi:hypothetical protein